MVASVLINLEKIPSSLDELGKSLRPSYKSLELFIYSIKVLYLEPVSISNDGSIPIALPYLLSFAAGAMLYVVVEELIPEMSAGEHSNLGTIFFALGFSLMMILDVALG